jgi:AcrR family transcriptional regulator
MDNRTQITEVALDLFSRHGFDAVGVQEIAAKAGITKPTLYHYFGSKSGLLQSILSENYQKLEASVKEPAIYHGDLPLTLHKVVSAYVSFAQANHTFYHMHMAMMFSPPESEAFKAVYPFVQSQIKMLEVLFLAASQDHGNMRGRHTLYALSLLGLINTYIQMASSGGIALDNEGVFKLVHQFMHGIYS